MNRDNIICDYLITDNEVIINSLYVEEKYRRRGYGTEYLKKIGLEAKKNNCDIIITPSNLSKIAIFFWLKNGFSTDNKDDNKIINFVLVSRKKFNYILNIDGQSVVELQKNIN